MMKRVNLTSRGSGIPFAVAICAGLAVCAVTAGSASSAESHNSRFTAKVSDAKSSIKSSGSDGLRARMEKIIFPHIEFNGADLASALDYMERRSKENDPEKIGVKINYGFKSAQLEKLQISLKRSNIPMSDLLRNVCQLTGMEYRIDQNSVFVSQKGGKVICKNNSVAANPLRQKLAEMIVPVMRFEEVELSEIVKFLHETSRSLDRKKRGVKFVLLPDKRLKSPQNKSSSAEKTRVIEDDGEFVAGTESGSEEELVTFSAKNVSLFYVIEKICMTCNCQYVIGEHAVVIAPIGVDMAGGETAPGPVRNR